MSVSSLTRLDLLILPGFYSNPSHFLRYFLFQLHESAGQIDDTSLLIILLRNILQPKVEDYWAPSTFATDCLHSIQSHIALDWPITAITISLLCIEGHVYLISLVPIVLPQSSSFACCMSTHNFTLQSQIARQYSPRRAPDVCIRPSGWILESRTSIAHLTSTPSHVIFDTTPPQAHARSCRYCIIVLQHDRVVLPSLRLACKIALRPQQCKKEIATSLGVQQWENSH